MRYSPATRFSYMAAVPIAVAVFVVISLSVNGQQQEPQQQRVAAARIDGTPVYVDQLERELDKALKGRQVTPEGKKVLQAQMLRQLIGQRLIVAYLTSKRQAASGQDVDLAIRQVEQKLAQQSLTLEEYLKRNKTPSADFRDALAWQIGWQRYLDRYLTEENFQRYFQKHRRQFDGTRLRVAHILLKVDMADESAQAKAIERAEALRKQIVAGQLAFDAAARRNSASPTAAKGGDIGWISRHEPMPEPFSAAAFALEKGQVSKPVTTVFGVHLIRCLEIEAGKKNWQSVRGELRLAMTRYLFNWVADQQRPLAKIEYTPAWPHFKPGTKELVE